jgi:hypothetical protein
MFSEMFHLPENEKEPLPVGEWFYELIWCPSQCYYHLQRSAVDYILYLRWRHENPWHAYIIKNKASLEAMNQENAVWSRDVFELYNLQYSDDELEMAMEKIVSLFHEFVSRIPEQ